VHAARRFLSRRRLNPMPTDAERWRESSYTATMIVTPTLRRALLRGSMSVSKPALLVAFLTLAASHSLAAQSMMAFKTGEETTGTTKQCLYDALGSAYTRTISSIDLCPLTVQVPASPKPNQSIPSLQVVPRAEIAVNDGSNPPSPVRSPRADHGFHLRGDGAVVTPLVARGAGASLPCRRSTVRCREVGQ